MAENKLRTMIETGKLDDLINNEKDKLCELRTSEEVLALLAKYSYHEPKEIFENELLDLLKNHVDDAELSKASGGVVNKRNLPRILGSVTLAGTMFLPVKWGNLPASAKRSNSSVRSFEGLGSDVKMGLGSVLIPGLPLTGVLLYVVYESLKECITTTKIKPTFNYNLSRKISNLLKKPDTNYDTNYDPNYEEIIGNVSEETLASYAVWELTTWKEAMKNHYETKTDGSYKTKNNDFVKAWNTNLGRLKKARFAVWLFGLKKKYYTSGKLKEFVLSHTNCDTSELPTYSDILCEEKPSVALEDVPFGKGITYYGLNPLEADGQRSKKNPQNVLLSPISQHWYGGAILTQRLRSTILAIWDT